MALGSAILLLAAVSGASSSDPELRCSGSENWAASSAYAHLKDAGLVGPETVDFSKINVVLLAQQRIGNDLYRQIHEIAFPLKSGSTVRVVSTSDASSEECSMGSVEIRVVGQTLGEYP